MCHFLDASRLDFPPSFLTLIIMPFSIFFKEEERYIATHSFHSSSLFAKYYFRKSESHNLERFIQCYLFSFLIFVIIYFSQA